MTNQERALMLAERAQSHAEKAGNVALDVEVMTRTGGLISNPAGGLATDQPSLIALAAMAHAQAAHAYMSASQAFGALPEADALNSLQGERRERLKRLVAWMESPEDVDTNVDIEAQT